MSQPFRISAPPPWLLSFPVGPQRMSFQGFPDAEEIAVSRAIQQLLRGRGSAHPMTRTAIHTQLASHGAFSPPGHGGQNPQHEALSYLQRVFAHHRPSSTPGSSLELSALIYLDAGGLIPRGSEVDYAAWSLPLWRGYTFLRWGKRMPEGVRSYIHTFVGGDHPMVDAMAEDTLAYCREKHLSFTFLFAYLSQIFSARLFERFRRFQHRAEDRWALDRSALESALAKASEASELRISSPCFEEIPYDVRVLKDVVLAKFEHPLLRLTALSAAKALIQHLPQPTKRGMRSFLIQEVLLPALQDTHPVIVGFAFDALVSRCLEAPERAALQQAGNNLLTPFQESPDFSLQRYATHHHDLVMRATHTWLTERILKGRALHSLSLEKLSLLRDLRPLHSLADFNPSRGDRRAVMEHHLHALLEAMQEAGPEDDVRNVFLQGRNGERIAAIDLGDRNKLLIQGHHRLAALLQAAAAGSIPGSWLEGIPIAVIHLKKKWPAHLIWRLFTLGRELSWPDLFPPTSGVHASVQKIGGSRVP